MNKKEIALDCMKKEYNCAQSVLFAFAEDAGLEKDTALKVAACFGGGMRCGEVCGAVTGALMAIGLKYGSSAPNDKSAQFPAYKKSMEFIKQFKEKHETILCRELLKMDVSGPEGMKEAMQKGLHKTVCANAIVSAVEIAEELI